MNAGKNAPSSSGDSGSNALAYGGTRGSPNPAATQTELWNGTAWTELNDYATNRSGSQKTGAINVGLCSISWRRPKINSNRRVDCSFK